MKPCSTRNLSFFLRLHAFMPLARFSTTHWKPYLPLEVRYLIRPTGEVFLYLSNNPDNKTWVLMLLSAVASAFLFFGGVLSGIEISVLNLMLLITGWLVFIIIIPFLGDDNV